MSFLDMYRPDSRTFSHQTEQDDDGDDCYNRVAERSRAPADAGLKALQLLSKMSPTRLDDQALLTLVAFTDESEGWSGAETAQIAREVLQHELDTPGDDTQFFVLKTVLEQYIRPLFSKARSATVTASGRRAAYADTADQASGLPDETRRTKPWKYEDLRALAVLAWAVDEASVGLFLHACLSTVSGFPRIHNPN